MDFNVFKHAVAKQFAAMVEKDHYLFETSVDKDTMWELYLHAFPEGTNEIFRVRRDYDCSCCRQFIRAFGGVVSIDPTTFKINSIWDINIPEEPAFHTVAKALSDLIHTTGIIEKPYFNETWQVGTDRTFEKVLDHSDPSITKAPLEFTHFMVRLPNYIHQHDKLTLNKKVSVLVGNQGVFKRALDELTTDASKTILDLIKQNALYRGDEYSKLIEEFMAQQEFCAQLTPHQKILYTWRYVMLEDDRKVARISGIRNTAIGTLMVDLSNDLDLEQAVGKFEAMVAPTNYKRSSALVTQAMVDKAKGVIAGLGLESSLMRRNATIDDLDVNNVFFIDRTSVVNNSVTDGMFDVNTKPSKQQFKGSSVVTMEQFLQERLASGTTTSLELYLENKHVSNMVNLTTAADPTAGLLFKWDNPFAWSYTGDVTDSIKERVKAAGGNVSGVFRCSLSWDYIDDLDLHMNEPAGISGNHIYYNNKISPTGMQLDVDMNANHINMSNTPVENIFIQKEAGIIRDKEYFIYVNNFNRRTSDGVGFTIEIEYRGEIKTMSYDKVVRSGENVAVARIIFDQNGEMQFLGHLPEHTLVKNIWGLDTNKFVPVKAAMLSPNFWNGQSIGNKHFFFMLKGCVNPEPARGFYNEFLRADLHDHRKVFELVGGKAKTVATENQLAGLGFSSTIPTEILFRVGGTFTSVIRVTI